MDKPSQQRIGFFGCMRARQSAKTSINDIARCGQRITITHGVLRKMKVKQLVWWFGHMDTMTSYNGKDFTGSDIPVYYLWHPHNYKSIRWIKTRMDTSGRMLPGSILRIRKNCDGHDLRIRAVMSRFDETQFGVDLMAGPLKLGAFAYVYKEVKGGLEVTSTLTLRNDLPVIGRGINWVSKRLLFREALIMAWIQHDIEAIGESEHFIPQLYAHAHKSKSKAD